MSVALVPVPEEAAMMVELSGRVHTTSIDLPAIISLTNMMEQVRDRAPPVESDDEGGVTITEFGAPTTIGMKMQNRIIQLYAL